MKKSLTTIAIIGSLTAFGQHDIGLKANGGLSCLSTKPNYTYWSETTQKIYFAPSGQGGLFYNFHLGDKSILGAELLFVQIEGKEHLETNLTSAGYPGEIMTIDIWRHISYVGLPIYYGYKIKKTIVTLGLQTNFTTASSGRQKGQTLRYGWDTKDDKLGIESYDYGARAGIIFNLSRKFAIEATYYYGINNIISTNNTQLNYQWKEWKVQQITIGLRYKFVSVGGQKSEKAKKA